MERANKATSTLVYSALMIFSLLIISGAECKVLTTGSRTDSVLFCNEIYGAQIGETCFTITQKFKLNAAFFTALNPNLNCDKIFVGEWLCLDGSTTV